MLYQVLTGSIQERLFLEADTLQDLASHVNEGSKQFIGVVSEAGQDVFLNKKMIIGFLPITVQANTQEEPVPENTHTGSAIETVIDDGNTDDNGLKIDGN